MATKKKPTVAEEVKAETEETEVEDPLKKAYYDLSTLPGRLTLDRMLQNAASSRSPLAWEKYRGAREMAESLGYTINVLDGRFHVLSHTV